MASHFHAGGIVKPVENILHQNINQYNNMPITCSYLVRLITTQALINDSYVISHNKWYMDKRVI